MTILFAVLLLMSGTILLLWGADWFIDGVRHLARKLGVSTLLLAIILVGLEPEEMLTAAVASAMGTGHLAVGNVIGTNVTIITLALGLSAALVPMKFAKNMHRQALLTGAAALIPIIFLLFGSIDRLIGFLLLALYAGYIYTLWRTDHQTMQAVLNDGNAVATGHNQPSWFKRTGQSGPFLLTIGGLLAMGVGGPLIVNGALQLTSTIGLGQQIIGSTIIALGTGAEMIALGISVARKGHATILIGAVLGSVAYNLLVTSGLAALINPLPPVTAALQPGLWLMILALIVLLLLVYRGRISRFVGWIGVSLYVLYLLISIVGGAMLSF